MTARPSTFPSPAIAVLMTCHNRRELTLHCLESLAGQAHFNPANLFLVDDGSADGTGAAVRAAMPQATVIDGDGSLWWNGGMQRAWEAAKARGGFDYYLWINDDVELLDGALAMLVDEATGHDAVIVTAATRDPETGRKTYGGSVRTDPLRPLRFALAEPAGEVQAVDTMSGNITLVSAAAEARLGGLDPRFTHIYGDLDYGLRAGAAGIPVLLASDFGGLCAGNEPAGSSLDPAASRMERLRRGLAEDASVHGRDWRRFVAKHTANPLRRMAHRAAPFARILAARPHPAGAGR